MTDELRPNPKFFGFDGVIGRYDYVTNLLYICMINVLFVLPLSGYLMSSVNALVDIFSLHLIFIEAPFFLKFWTLIGVSVCSYCMVSNVCRRVNDITGQVDRNRNIAVSSVFVLASAGIYFPDFISAFFILQAPLPACFFCAKKVLLQEVIPTITEKSLIGGAFFGTWIWGLFNKSYKTLWALLLCITPWNTLYSVYCGLKGNEWAASNRDWASFEDFKKSQEKQTVFFVVLNVIIFPVLIFIIILALIFGIAFLAVDETKTSPEHRSVVFEKLDSTLNSYVSGYFESHTITSEENKFYVLPDDWAQYSFNEKRDILDAAATLSAAERDKLDKKNYHSKHEELKRTKIYSSKNHELLGEFYIDNCFMSSDKSGFKDAVLASMRAYKFYKPTEK